MLVEIVYVVIYIEFHILHPKKVSSSYLTGNVLNFAHNFIPFIKGA